MLVFPRFQLWYYHICGQALSTHIFSADPCRQMLGCQHQCSVLLAFCRSRQGSRRDSPTWSGDLQGTPLLTEETWVQSYHHSFEVLLKHTLTRTQWYPKAAFFLFCGFFFLSIFAIMSIRGPFLSLIHFFFSHNLLPNLFPVSFYTLQSVVWVHIILCFLCLYFQVPEDLNWQLSCFDKDIENKSLVSSKATR